jgi:hypothetical protein
MTVRHVCAAVLAVAAALALPASASGLPPFSTAAKTGSSSGRQAEVYQVATGCHSTYDRLVIRSRFGTPGYDVRYVSVVRHDATGNVVPLLGTRRIRVLVRDARGHTEAGTNLLPRVLTPRCPNLLQVKDAGDFEGLVTLGLGLQRRTGFRVFRLTAPTRLVIDIAH